MYQQSLHEELVEIESQLVNNSGFDSSLSDRYIEILSKYALTRSDYCFCPLKLDTYPVIMKKYQSQCNISVQIITILSQRIDELDDYLRIHDVLDFSCYLAQVVYQTTGNLEDFLATNSVMKSIAERARFRCYDLVNSFGGSKMLEIVESVIDTISGLFEELDFQLKSAFSNCSNLKKKHCAKKITNQSEPDYLRLIDDVFDFAITSSNNFENNSAQYTRKRNELIAQFVCSYAE